MWILNPDLGVSLAALNLEESSNAIGNSYLLHIPPLKMYRVLIFMRKMKMRMVIITLYYFNLCFISRLDRYNIATSNLKVDFRYIASFINEF